MSFCDVMFRKFWTGKCDENLNLEGNNARPKLCAAFKIH
jgi:hypothetical protein